MTAPQSINKAQAAVRAAWKEANAFALDPRQRQIGSPEHRLAVQAARDAERQLVQIRRERNATF